MALTDVDTADSPGWWFVRLAKEQAERRERLDDLWARYEGNPPVPEGVQSAKDAYKAFQKKSRTNYAKLIADAVRHRLKITGFRTAALGDQNMDVEARKMWVANDLDVEFATLLEFVTVMSEGYTIVAPPDPTDDSAVKYPIITAEDPRDVITAHDPVRQSKVLAALKVYFDDVTEQNVAYVYLPGRVFRATTVAGSKSIVGSGFTPRADDWTFDAPQVIPTKRVPVVRFRNPGGKGEFEPHIQTLDRIDTTVFQRMVVVSLQAFRQRGIKGMPTHYPEGHAQQGELIEYPDDLFTSAPDSFWLFPPGAEMWESGQVDLSPILNSVTNDVRELAAVTQTPFYAFNPDAAGGSAEGASLQREGLVFKTEDKQASLGSAAAATMSLGFEYLNDSVRADVQQIEALWAPAERVSLSQRYDAAQKAKGVIPNRSILSDVLQFGPKDVTRMESERTDDFLLTGTVDDDPAATPPAA